MPIGAPYSNITSLQANQALAMRLNDPGYIHWTKAELNLYIAEALRFWQVLTQYWLSEFVTNYTQPNPATLPTWQSTGNSLNTFVGSNPTSPRTQTLNDSYIYTVAEYMLLEPPAGNAAWIGSSQFVLGDFTQALQRRRDQVIQRTACFLGPYAATVNLIPNTNRLFLPDSTAQSILDLRRIRYIPATGFGTPATLFRDDSLAFEYFENSFEQNIGTPLAWDVIGSPPQTVTFDASPNVPNTLEILAMLSAGQITPPTVSPLFMPDDWSWGLKFGMMADLLNKDTESTDPQRAAYCTQRFEEFLKLAVAMPWMTQARINNVPVDTSSVTEADDFSYEWQSNPNTPAQIVRGGIDLFAIAPTIPAGTNLGLTLTLVENAPIPTADTDFIQCSPDVLDCIIDEAQHLASFKDGFSSLQQTMALHKNFIKLAEETNSRLRISGIFDTTLRPKVSRQEEIMPRYAVQGGKS